MTKSLNTALPPVGGYGQKIKNEVLAEPAQGKVKKEKKLSIPEQKEKNNYRSLWGSSNDKKGCRNCIFNISGYCKNLIKPYPDKNSAGEMSKYGAVYHGNTCDLYIQKYNLPGKDGIYLYDGDNSERLEYFVSHKISLFLDLTEIAADKWISGYTIKWNSFKRAVVNQPMAKGRDIFNTRDRALIALVKEIIPELQKSCDIANAKQMEEGEKAYSWLNLILQVTGMPVPEKQNFKVGDRAYYSGHHWHCKNSSVSGIITNLRKEDVNIKCDLCQTGFYADKLKLIKIPLPKENILPAAASEPDQEPEEKILPGSKVKVSTTSVIYPGKTAKVLNADQNDPNTFEIQFGDGNVFRANKLILTLISDEPVQVPGNNNLIEMEETQLSEIIQAEENIKPAEAVESLSEQLTRCENQVKMGLGMMKQGVSAIGKALEEIVESKLYRLKKETFEIFCPEYFGISSKQAYDYIGAYHDLEHIKAFSPIGDKALPLPTNESQTRSIRNLSPEKKAEIYNTAVQESGGKTPTAAKIKEVADRDKPKKPDPAYYQKIELDKLKGAVQEKQTEEITGPEKVTGNDNPWIPELNKTFKLTGPEVLGKFSKVTVPGKDNTREPGEIIEVIPKEKPDDSLKYKVLLYNFPTKKPIVYPEREVKAMEKGTTWNEEQLPGQISILEALDEAESSTGEKIEKFKYIKNEIFHLPNRNAPISMIILNHPGHGHFSISVYPEPEKVYSPYTGELLEVEK
jgi:hypothetical protein